YRPGTFPSANGSIRHPGERSMSKYDQPGDKNGTDPHLSDLLQDLLNQMNGADGTATSNTKLKDALKADYGALDKLAGDIKQTVAAYEKVYPQFQTRIDALNSFVENKLEILEALGESDLSQEEKEAIKNKVEHLKADLRTLWERLAKSKAKLRETTL